MKLLPFWVFTLMLVSANTREDQNTCSKNICEVFSLLENESYTRREFESNLDVFVFENNLESGHMALKRVLEDMGNSIQVKQNHPLQTYVIKHQKLLHEEAQRKLNQALRDMQVQLVSKFQSVEKQQLKTSTLISERLNQNASGAEFNLSKKLDNIEMGLSKKIDGQIHNIISVIFEGLAQKLNPFEVKIIDMMNQAEINHIKKFEDQIQNVSQKYEDSVINLITKLNDVQVQITRNMAEQIRNITLEDITKIHTKKVNEVEVKLTTKSNESVEETRNIHPKPSDCFDIFNDGEMKSGVYTIFIEGLNTNGTSVFCNGRGWTVFLKRQKQATQENFIRNWNEFKHGFGNPAAEYWMGNEALHLMTTSKTYVMRTDIVGLGSPSNVWGEYSQFQVESESNKYRLIIDGYNRAGSISNDPGFGLNNGKYFSTVDIDNDGHSALNCAKYDGAFWHDKCSYNDPTAVYKKMEFNPWSTTDEKENYATDIEMKIRPKSENGK